MTEEPKPAEGQEPTAQEPQEPTESKFKDDKTYQAMSQQIADMRRKEQEREAADLKAKKDLELKELEARGEYESVTKSLKAEMDQLRTEHASEMQKRDLTTELLKAGFNNDLFMAGAVTNYNSETFGEISDYVSTLAKDEANAAFIGTGTPARDPKDPPPRAGVSKGEPNLDQIKVWEKSDNREERLKALDFNKKYREKYDKYPY